MTNFIKLCIIAIVFQIQHAGLLNKIKNIYQLFNNQQQIQFYDPEIFETNLLDQIQNESQTNHSIQEQTQNLNNDLSIQNSGNNSSNLLPVQIDTTNYLTIQDSESIYISAINSLTKQKQIQEEKDKLEGYKELPPYELLQNFAIKNKVPNQCQIDVNLLQNLKNNYQIVGKGGFGVVLKYNNFAYKVQRQSHKYPIIRQAINEFKVMQKYQNHNSGLFLNNIQCFVTMYENFGFLVIKQPLLGNDMSYFHTHKNNGQQFFYIKEISYDNHRRYDMYMTLMQQLEIMHSNDDVHMDIKPENILSNIKFEDILRNQSQNLGDLKLFLTDFGLTVPINKIYYAGTLNYMHPLFAHQLTLYTQKFLDVYSLALTLLIIESYKYNKDINDFFAKYSNQLSKIKFNSFDAIQDKKQHDLLKLYISKQLQSYMKAAIQQQCRKQDQKEILKNYKNYYDKVDRNYFYRNYCMGCHACVLASVFQMDTSLIPSIEQLKQGILDVQNLTINYI